MRISIIKKIFAFFVITMISATAITVDAKSYSSSSSSRSYSSPSSSSSSRSYSSPSSSSTTSSRSYGSTSSSTSKPSTSTSTSSRSWFGGGSSSSSSSSASRSSTAAGSSRTWSSGGWGTGYGRSTFSSFSSFHYTPYFGFHYPMFSPYYGGYAFYHPYGMYYGMNGYFNSMWMTSWMYPAGGYQSAPYQTAGIFIFILLFLLPLIIWLECYLWTTDRRYIFWIIPALLILSLFF